MYIGSYFGRVVYLFKFRTPLPFKLEFDIYTHGGAILDFICSRFLFFFFVFFWGVESILDILDEEYSTSNSKHQHAIRGTCTYLYIYMCSSSSTYKLVTEHKLV